MNLLLKKISFALLESFQAFKIIPSPKLVMTLLVKNEEDMLEKNLQFHKAMGVDGFIITDNNSTDRTPEIIQQYQEKGWIWESIKEPGTNYQQKKWVDRMIWIAKRKYHADWVINADADEFWYPASGNLKNFISKTRANVINVKPRSVYPEDDKPFWQWNRTVKPVPNYAEYDLSNYPIFERQYKKVLHRTTGYIQISMGNHKVVMFPKKSVESDIYIYHYNIRGRKQFLSKMINGGKQLEQDPNKNRGRHWRYFYQLYKEQRLEEEYNRVIGLNNYDRLEKDGYIQTDNTIVDFFKTYKP